MREDKRSYYKNNRLKQMRAFCEVIQCGSITLAAQKLFLSQPSVTLQIQAMERELGVTVFERRGPVLKLTPDGEALYTLAKPLVEGIDSLQENFVSNNSKLDSGELNIGAGESTILYILPEAVRRFVSAYPRIQLKIHNETGRDGLKAESLWLRAASQLDPCRRNLAS